MLTGTPLDLTPLGDVLRWVGNGIVLAWFAATVWLVASRVAKRPTPREKWVSAAKVLGVMVGIPAVLIGWQVVGAWKERARYEKAATLFKKRCETAGETIHKSIPDVKGIVWMKWRPKNINLSNQFDMNDPFGRDCGGEECLKELLVATEGAELKSKGDPYGDRGYEFVESADPADGNWYRYTLRLYRPHERDPKWLETLVRSELVKQPIPKSTARYGLTWDDISTREDRENWIAGGSLTAVDLKTNEVVAKRVGYMMDKGLGSEAGFRSPWSFAAYNACPAKLDESGKMTRVGFMRRFAIGVLQPIKGANK